MVLVRPESRVRAGFWGHLAVPSVGRRDGTRYSRPVKRMRWMTLALTVCLAGLACAGPPPAPAPVGVVVPADAVADVAFASLDDAVAVHDALAGAGIIETKVGQLSRSGLEAAGVGAPAAVSSRGVGGVVVSAVLTDAVRFNAAVSLVLGDVGWRRRRVLGQVDALEDTDGATRALVRAGNGQVVIVINPDDVAAEAALVEALCGGGLEPLRRDPQVSTATVQPMGPLKGIIDGALTGVVTTAGATLSVSASGALSSSPAAQALSSSLRSAPSPQACVAEDGAIVVAHVPAVAAVKSAAQDLADDSIGAAVDAFDGRLTIAIRPPPNGTASDPDDLATLASLVVVGTPRGSTGAGALRASVNEALAGAPVASKVVGSRTVRTVSPPGRPWRQVAVVTDDDVFVFGLGDSAVVDRVAAGPVCGPNTRLVVADGAALAELVGRAKPELGVLRRLARLTGAEDPLGLLLGVQRAELEASAGQPGRLDLRLALTLGRRAR